MRAVTFSDGRIEVADRPDPTPGTGQVLVRVRAAGLNNADLIQSRGGYPAPPDSPPDILGLELAGEVAEVGPGALRFSVGDRVMAVIGGGAQAELAAVNERLLVPVPTGVGWPAAGGFPEVFTTAHDALFTQCGLAMGEHLLVHGAGGGVGTAAVQLGVAAGARVTASVRRPELRSRVAQLGAEVVEPGDFEAHGPYDVVIELVSAGNLPGNLRALARRGRITVIGHGGDGPAELDLGLLMFKRARIHGSTLRSRSLEDKADAARRVEAHVLPLLEAGRVAPPVDTVFALEEAAAAYERFAAGGKFGKIVLEMPAG